MKTSIGAALALLLGAVILIVYNSIDSRAARNAGRVTSALAEPNGPPVARRGTPPSEAAEPRAEPPASVVETSPLPASLQVALDRDPTSRVAQLHAQMAREARDSGWALETEYRLQVALHDEAPKLLGRVQLLTTCASSMCEMVGVINGVNPGQASRDTREWQLVLQRVPASSAWVAMDLDRPVGSLFTPSSEGGRSFIVEFPRKRLASR